MKCPYCKKEIGLFRRAGAKGGSVTGKSKVRGNSDYYRSIALKRKVPLKP